MLADQNNAEAFFEQWGLPNLLDDDEDMDDPEETHSQGRWTPEKLDSPLFKGCRYTVREFSFAMMKIKTGSIRDDRADLLCKLCAEVLPPTYKGPRYGITGLF